MTKFSRRQFLRGGQRDANTEGSKRENQPGISTDTNNLPRVIAWLDRDPQSAQSSNTPRTRRALPILRPPGAIAEASFLQKCTKCNACADACPHNAIVPAGPMFRHAQGTPRIDPSKSPCLLCEDFPCIAACEDEALIDGADVMGFARINPLDCLNSMGSTCTVCIERCPIEGTIIATNRVPTIQQTSCVGCGICHYACPAPTNAIAIMPNPRRIAEEATNA